jgi:tyrosyl-tRNA synthetase
MKNLATYKEQAYKILDKDKLEIVFNGTWFEKLSFQDVIKLVSKFTLAQMLEHDYFDKRFKGGMPLSMHEMLYPMMQGYDSVMIKADIELGGTDQRFNVIAGRYLQKESGQESQVGLFTPILMGLDGKNKMSKSLNNYIGLNDKPEDMYGKVMSIPDELIIQYFELATDVDMEEIREMEKSMKEGTNPRDIKKKLARVIVKRFHTEAAANAAEENFSRIFSGRELPEEIEEFKVTEEKLSVVKLLTMTKLVKSNSEAQRLISQGGVYINKERIDDYKKEIHIKEPLILKVGKRKFLKIVR